MMDQIKNSKSLTNDNYLPKAQKHTIVVPDNDRDPPL